MSAPATTEPLTAPASPPPAAGVWPWAALLVALVGLGGSLFLSLGLHLKACPLCFYQRSFVMGLVAVLGMGLLAGAARPGRLALLALPLAVAGLGVALFHVSLELRGKLECPAGVFGLGTAPRQSLAVFVALTALLAAGALRRPRAAGAAAAAVVLGGVLAVGSLVANPPPPAAPTKPYDTPPEICRPPFHPPQRETASTARPASAAAPPAPRGTP
jgi:disulfide bond formation protein DsbB